MSNKIDNLLRPSSFEKFFGQEDITSQLKIHIFSAKNRKTVLSHILFYGPPGLGKTSLANILANEMGSKIVTVTAISLEKVPDLVSILGQLEPGDILFIDEIHRLKIELCELLYSAMEDFKIYVSYKNDENTKLLTLNLAPFTLIGATTNIGSISKPLYDRFALIFKFNYYDEQTLWKIIDQNSKFFNLNIDEKLYPLITERSRFTPRYLNNILLKISDYSLYYNVKKFNEKELLHAFEIMKINEGGLTYEDIEIIKIIGKNFSNRPVSLEAVASMLNEDANNIKNVNEPFLVMSNIILRTKRGRMLSQKGLKILEKYS